jgi:chromosome segregation ATPase
VTTDDRQEPKERKPTVWIVLCGVLAVAVVCLGVWAFSAQSDADDAQAALDAQERAASAATPEPEPEPEPAPEVDPAVQQQFEQLAGELGAAGDSLDDIEQQLEQASARVDEAAQAREDAGGAIDAAKAEAEEFKAQFELTRTCLRGTLDAVGAAFEGGGLEAAAQELQKLAGSCQSAAS